MRRIIPFLCLVGTSIPAMAQSDSPFYGNWTVTWEGKKQVYEAKLALAAEGGTWKTSARDKGNPCVGREVPVKVKSISEHSAELTLAFSDAIPGCKDSAVVLKLNGNAVTGVRGENELTLKRE